MVLVSVLIYSELCELMYIYTKIQQPEPNIKIRAAQILNFKKRVILI